MVTYSTFLWHFTLDERLSLNITFIDVQFIGGAVNFVNGSLHCDLGNLKILKHNHRDYPFLFCGQKSIFSVFPRFSKLSVLVQVSYSALYTLRAAFVVLDKNAIVSIKKDSPFGHLKPHLTHQIRKSFLSFVLLIQVQKTRHILILPQMNLIDLLVLNGPGFQSKQIEPIDGIFTSFGFHCLLQILIYFKKTYNESRLKYATNLSSTAHMNWTTKLNFHLPFSDFCDGTICLLHIHTQHLHVNATVLGVTYQGKQSETCKYGGFTAAEMVEGIYQENSILCQTHNGSSSQGRSFYSSKSSLILVLFWYLEYSNISTSLLIDSTPCQHVRLCPCTLSSLCKRNTSLCTDYIEQQIEATHFTSSEIYVGEKSPYRDYPLVFVDVGELSCIVLSFHRFSSCSPYGLPGQFDLMIKRGEHTYSWVMRGHFLGNPNQAQDVPYFCEQKPPVVAQYYDEQQNKIVLKESRGQGIYNYLLLSHCESEISVEEPISAYYSFEMHIQRIIETSKTVFHKSDFDGSMQCQVR